MKYFVAKKNSLCYTIYIIWIILLCEFPFTRYDIVFASLSQSTREAICFGLLASELADKPYIDYRIGRCTMAVSYKKLWKLLIEKDMKKTDLRIKAGISTGALAKLGKNENVNTEVLAKICKVLECGVDDIMEFVAEE